VHLAETLRDLVGVREVPARWTLDAALARIAREGQGVVVILREQESPRELADAVRGDISAMTPPTQSTDPAVAPVWRTYGIGAQILQDLGVRRMRVLSSPKQMQGLSAFDLEVLEYIGPGDAPGDVDAR
jgi:3,4-dihydroxy 2-butanone 4-phosphate synthase/GTP cyclohydrolase II